MSKLMSQMAFNQTRQMQRVTQLAATQRFSFGAFANHRDTADNMEESPFEFTEESYAAIEDLLKKYPDNYKSSGVIPVLFIAQKQNNNFLTLSAMHKVAKVLEMTPMQVYEVASFYTMFNRTKVGKYHLQVCGTTPCMIRGVSLFNQKHCEINSFDSYNRLVKLFVPSKTSTTLDIMRLVLMDSSLFLRSNASVLALMPL